MLRANHFPKIKIYFVLTRFLLFILQSDNLKDTYTCLFNLFQEVLNVEVSTPKIGDHVHILIFPNQ